MWESLKRTQKYPFLQSQICRNFWLTAIFKRGKYWGVNLSMLPLNFGTKYCDSNIGYFFSFCAFFSIFIDGSHISLFPYFAF